MHAVNQSQAVRLGISWSVAALLRDVVVVGRTRRRSMSLAMLTMKTGKSCMDFCFYACMCFYSSSYDALLIILDLLDLCTLASEKVMFSLKNSTLYYITTLEP